MNLEELCKVADSFTFVKGKRNTKQRVLDASGEQIAKDRRASGDADIAFLEGKGFDVFKVDEHGNFYVKNFYEVVPKKFRSKSFWYGSDQSELDEWWESNIGENWGFQPDEDVLATYGG